MRRFARSSMLVLLLAGAGVGAALLFGAADRDEPGTRPSPSPSAADDLEQFTDPFEEAAGERPCCPTGMIVDVNEGCLNVRAVPSTGAAVRACAANGSLIYADQEQRRRADGFTWVRVLVTAEDPYVLGWVAGEFLGGCDHGASACAFTNGIDLEKLRADIDNRLEDASDDGIDGLECDEDATRVLVGDVFSCTAPRESGGTIELEVLVLLEDPHFDWRVAAT